MSEAILGCHNLEGLWDAPRHSTMPRTAPQGKDPSDPKRAEVEKLCCKHSAKRDLTQLETNKISERETGELLVGLAATKGVHVLLDQSVGVVYFFQFVLFKSGPWNLLSFSLG